MTMELSNLSSCYPFSEDAILSFICSPIPSKYAEWTSEEDKLFEKALALHDLNSLDFFHKIAFNIPGKTVEQIKQHFQVLVEDVKFIETYCGALPNYGPPNNSKTTNKTKQKSISSSLKTCVDIHDHQQKKKGTRWTKEEHEEFIVGINKYGKGDWRSISRYCVLTKTPTQVASHAQKYFIRLAKLSSSSTTTPKSNPLNFSTTNIMTMASPTSQSSSCIDSTTACIDLQSSLAYYMSFIQHKETLEDSLLMVHANGDHQQI